MRGASWRALAWGVCPATAGAVVAYVLAGGPWAAAGAAVGAVTGSFAPTMYDGIRKRQARRDELLGTSERPPPQSWARLLDPRRELVRFIGRDNELAALVAWCSGAEADRLRLVTGPGGVGKTRLAVELCERMAKQGWVAMRVADGQESDAVNSLRGVSRSRALLVIDYAETRIGLKRMLAVLAGEHGKGVKVLMLARATGDWWDQLGVGEAAVWDMIQAARSAPMVLSPAVAEGLSDAQVIASAVTAFSRELELPERVVDIHGDSGTGPRRMLDLQAAALVAVLGESATGVVRVDIRTVIDELLRHEQHFWYETARAQGLLSGPDGTSLKVTRQVIAAACLLGAATRQEGSALTGRVPGVHPSTKIADWLRGLYPPDGGEMEWLGTMQPDRLAELHVMRELVASPELAEACLTRLDSRQGLRAVALLARASSDYPEAEALLSGTLPKVAELIADMQAPAETLATIFNAIPYPTVVLSPAAVTLGKRITKDLPPGTDPAVRAYWLSSLGNRLCELGRPSEALPVIEEAVAIRRGLATVSPERHRADLAKSLINLQVALVDLGRPADALPAITEALTIRRDLAAASAVSRSPDVAAVLFNLGTTLSVLGRFTDALAADLEAIAIRRELAAADPARYRGELADSLSNLSVRYSALGQHTDALAADLEAVAIARQLAATSPEPFSSHLAAALHNLAATLSDLGRPTEALPPAEEALTIRRGLAQAVPDRYRADLSASLDNLCTVLSELDRLVEALPLAEEALAIRRELTAARPDRYRPDLATSLMNKGAILAQLGQLDQALTVTEAAVAIQQELAGARPERYRQELATALGNLAEILTALGLDTDAAAARAEKAALSRGPA